MNIPVYGCFDTGMIHQLWQIPIPQFFFEILSQAEVLSACVKKNTYCYTIIITHSILFLKALLKTFMF